MWEPNLVLAAVVLAAFPASALPARGAAVPEVSVEGIDGRTRMLPDRRIAILVVCESRTARAQNHHVEALLDRVTAGAANRARVELVPVADVESYDFWPARRYVRADIRARIRRDGTEIYVDWKGRVRRAWGLSRDKSAFVLLGVDGRVRFAAEGPLGKPQVDDLVSRLAELGVTVR